MLVPMISIANPIPGIGYAPLFVLWFGLGNVPAVMLVAVASVFPVIVNTWTGVRTVKRVWVHSAEAMGAGEYQLFQKVMLPAALPYILMGCRLGFARAWRVLVAVEMLTAVPRGLGWMIFGAKEFMRTDVMLAGIVVIGIAGLALEKLVFEPLERFTLVRWNMVVT
jgi:ABC-type nitrate/sulfonate/bicarbonate transport system permease component